MTTLTLSSGIAGAMNSEVGLIECPEVTCAVVTIEDVKAAHEARSVAVYRTRAFPGGPYDPRFTEH